MGLLLGLLPETFSTATDAKYVMMVPLKKVDFPYQFVEAFSMELTNLIRSRLPDVGMNATQLSKLSQFSKADLQVTDPSFCSNCGYNWTCLVRVSGQEAELAVQKVNRIYTQAAATFRKAVAESGGTAETSVALKIHDCSNQTLASICNLKQHEEDSFALVVYLVNCGLLVVGSVLTLVMLRRDISKRVQNLTDIQNINAERVERQRSHQDYAPSSPHGGPSAGTVLQEPGQITPTVTVLQTPTIKTSGIGSALAKDIEIEDPASFFQKQQSKGVIAPTSPSSQSSDKISISSDHEFKAPGGPQLARAASTPISVHPEMMGAEHIESTYIFSETLDRLASGVFVYLLSLALEVSVVGLLMVTYWGSIAWAIVFIGCASYVLFFKGGGAFQGFREPEDLRYMCAGAIWITGVGALFVFGSRFAEEITDKTGSAKPNAWVFLVFPFAMAIIAWLLKRT
eukprot:CAMPEP_0175132426 /NCGR_PEP_ID=MMETSP0087-20121206/7069_1 /TAXON_ID=136419 /ORGANISM="Unknown Unknown, Strain D1" /LENGTH=455 /DNA_ID=CAMNT_0016414781 /DNA_START=60 /DNA_END=1423 /DNA_ORIENTATION=+